MDLDFVPGTLDSKTPGFLKIRHRKKMPTFDTENGSFYTEIGTFYTEIGTNHQRKLLKLKENAPNRLKKRSFFPGGDTISTL